MEGHYIEKEKCLDCSYYDSGYDDEDNNSNISKTDKDSESENEEMDYPCKNECCCDYVDVDGKYCEDCAPDVKICKECNEEFCDKYSNFKKCFECRDEDNDSCDDIEINEVINENNNQLNNINQYHKVKEISELPQEIKYKILLDVLKYKRRDYKLEKSKQPIHKFNKYNEMYNLSYNIDFDKYRIGDCILHRGKTNYSFREKKMYIRGWCIKCKGPNNELEDICKSCRDVERHGYLAILADTGYKVCNNCYERFKYNDWDKDKYCLWCQDLRIFSIIIKN